MPYGTGYGMGFGFRGASPPWPYVGRGRGGLPRCWAYAPPPYYGPQAGPGPVPYGQWGSREDEVDFLREEADALKAHLDEIEARIKGLESE